MPGFSKSNFFPNLNPPKFQLIGFGLAGWKNEKILFQRSDFKFAAPELKKEMVFTKAIDMWSLGVILHCMLTGEMPYKSTLESISYGVIDQQKYAYKSLTSLAREVLKGLLQPKPGKRMTMKQLEKTHWMKDKHVEQSNFLAFRNDKSSMTD